MEFGEAVKKEILPGRKTGFQNRDRFRPDIIQKFRRNRLNGPPVLPPAKGRCSDTKCARPGKVRYPTNQSSKSPATMLHKPKKRSCPSCSSSICWNMLRHLAGDKKGSSPSITNTRATAAHRLLLPSSKITSWLEQQRCQRHHYRASP